MPFCLGKFSYFLFKNESEVLGVEKHILNKFYKKGRKGVFTQVWCQGHEQRNLSSSCVHTSCFLYVPKNSRRKKGRREDGLRKEGGRTEEGRREDGLRKVGGWTGEGRKFLLPGI